MDENGPDKMLFHSSQPSETNQGNLPSSTSHIDGMQQTYNGLPTVQLQEFPLHNDDDAKMSASTGENEKIHLSPNKDITPNTSQETLIESQTYKYYSDINSESKTKGHSEVCVTQTLSEKECIPDQNKEADNVSCSTESQTPSVTHPPAELKELFSLPNGEDMQQQLLKQASSMKQIDIYQPSTKPTCDPSQTHEQVNWSLVMQESSDCGGENKFHQNCEVKNTSTCNSIQKSEKAISDSSNTTQNVNDKDSLSSQILQHPKHFLHQHEQKCHSQGRDLKDSDSSTSLNALTPSSSPQTALHSNSLASLSDIGNVSQTGLSQQPSLVVHNGVLCEMYTEERHLVVQAGVKAQTVSTSNTTLHCQHCTKTFADNRSLQRHMLIHMGVRPYRCHICSKAFMLNGDLTRHMRIHSGERPFECEVCGRRFTLKGNLMQHFRTHSPEKQFTCTICYKNYAQKDSLHRHIRAHFGEKPYECSTCGKRFTLKGDLSRHILIHSGLKPHSCKLCGRQFALKGNLTQHMRIHTKERTQNFNVKNPNAHLVRSLHDSTSGHNFTYQELHKTVGSGVTNGSLTTTLTTPSQLRSSNTMNIQAETPQVSGYVSFSQPEVCRGQTSGLSFCSECSKTFPSAESLHEHVHLIHEQSTRLASNKYMCNICEKEFYLKGDLTRHLNSHNGVKPYECQFCNKMFTLKSNLRQHLTTHRREKPFSCPMCEKPFGNQRNLKLHLKRHEQARANFACTKCGRAFLAKSDHFFHQCVKAETTTPPSVPQHPNHNTSGPNSATFTNVPPSSSSSSSSSSPPQSQIKTISRSTNNITQVSTSLTPLQVKREYVKSSCISSTTSPQTNNAFNVNGVQTLMGPIYRHLYFTTSQQGPMPVLNNLTTTPNVGISNPENVMCCTSG